MKRIFNRSISNEFAMAIAEINRRIRKVLVVILLIAFLGSYIPQKQQVQAIEYDTSSETSETEPSEKIKYNTTTDSDFNAADVEIQSEVTALRTETTKTFLKVDGTYVVAMYNDVIHYEENGKFKDIDNALILDTESDEYENTANKFQIKLPKNLDENKKIELSMDDYSIKWTVSGIEKTAIDCATKAEKSDNLKELTGITQEVTYSNIQDDVSLQYYITGSKLKENIILDKYIENYSITFTYTLKGLTYQTDQEGEGVFVNESGETIFSFDDLYMDDSDGNTSDDVKVVVSNTKTSEYVITITPNDEWMSKAIYPVTIDPTISSKTQSMSIQDTYVNSAYPTTNYSTRTYMNISGTSEIYEYRGLISFVLPAVIMDKAINYTYLTLSKYTKTTERVIGLYKNTVAFDASAVTWSTKPIPETSMTDYHVTGTSDTYKFDITEAVKEWQATGNTQTTGFTLRDKEYTGATNSVKTTEYYGTTYAPVIEIGYIDPEGIRDYWTYSSQDVGAAGTGYVSDYTGLLSFVRNDISFSTDKQSMTLAIAYNPIDKTNYGYGSGWNINYNSRIYLDEDLSLYYNQDYTGNKVYYHSCSCDDRIKYSEVQTSYCYLAEDGSGNMLVRQFAYEELTTQYIISSDSIKQHYDIEGYLTSIYDTTKNVGIYVTRDGSNKNKVLEITDSSGNTILVEYDYYGNMNKASLYLMQDSALSLKPLEEVQYYYTYKSYLLDRVPYYVYYYKNYLVESARVKDETVYYSHDSYGRLYQAYLASREKVYYTYVSGTDKIATIQSKFGTAIYSQITCDYGFKVSTLTNQTGDYIIYKFDDYGHTVNLLDSDGNAQYFKYANLFNGYEDENGFYTLSDGTPNYYNNHHLVSQSVPQTTIYNPVNNHGFEYDNTFSECDWDLVIDSQAGSSIETEYTRDDGEAMIGEYAGEIETYPLAPDYGHLKQTVILDIGAYTLSGYIKNTTSSNDVFIDIVGEDYGGGNQSVINNGEWTKVVITFGISSNDKSVDIWLANHASGKAYFDDIQIVEGFVDNRTNMMDNPSFEVVDVYGVLPGWYENSAEVTRISTELMTDNLYENIIGDYGIEIEGSATESRWIMTGISDFLDVGKLNEEGKLVIGAWADSLGTPITTMSSDITDGNPRYFRIRVDFLSNIHSVFSEDYDEYVIVSKYIDFDTSIEGWQYMYGEVSLPEENVAWINLFLEYQGEGCVYFDGIQVYYENNYTNYAYNQYGKITLIETSAGDITEYFYDLEKNYPSFPEQIKLADETDVNISTNEANQVDEVIYNNVASTPTYNNYGQVTSLKIGDESNYFTTSTSYTHFSQYASSITNEYGKVTNNYYETLTGLMEAIENSKGVDTHYLYDNEGKLIEVVNVEDYTNYTSEDVFGKVEYLYDSYDRLWKIVLDTDFYYSISYDAQGRMSQVSVNNQPLMSYSYEMDETYYTDRLETQTYGNGDIIKFVYNSKDQIETVQFMDVNELEYSDKFSYEYDQAGRLAVYNTIVGGVIVGSEYYTYDSSGNLIQVVDEAGNKTQYIYDTSGNLTSLHFEIDSNANTTNYTYNECFEYSGEECISTSALYDKTDYQTESDINVVKDYHYETEALYRLDYIRLSIDTLNIKQDFIFSGDTSRISQITYDIFEDGIDYKYSYSYDELGNIIEVSYYENATLISKDNYTYDELDQLVIEDVYKSNDEDSCVGSDHCFTNIYTYDIRGNILQKSTYNYGAREDGYPIPDFMWDNSSSVNVFMRYNGYNSYDDIYYLDLDETPSLTFVYYNPETGVPYSGVRTFLMGTNLDIGTPGYYYRDYWASSLAGIDIMFRIVFAVGDVTPPEADKIINYVYSEDWLDQLASYDIIINGTPASHDFTYDAQGNPITIDNFAFNGTEYDHANLEWDGRQLSSISIFNEYDVEVHTISYTYNDSGYRTSKTIDEETIEYTLIGDKVIYETNGTYAITYTYDYDGKIISFSYDPNTNVSNDEAEYFYLSNQQGDITHILDASGNTIVKYRYDAYGNIIDIQDVSQNDIISSINPYTYRRYRYDSEINMYYLNSRYYDPVIGRFISSDGLLGQSGDILSTNMYAYCANNPVMYTDSDGNMAELIAGLTLGQVALAVVAVVVATVAVLAIADVIGIPGAGDVLDGVKDTINQIGQSIQNSLDKVKQNIKIFAIAAAVAIGTKNNSGTYVIQFESGHVYVGKGGYLRACTSALYQSFRHGDTPTAFIYYSAENDREAFKQEYILMVDYGFHKTDILYNQIWSPGRAYYYQDNGSYYPGDPGW